MKNLEIITEIERLQFIEKLESSINELEKENINFKVQYSITTSGGVIVYSALIIKNVEVN